MKNEKYLRSLIRKTLNENINQQLNEEPSNRDAIKYHINPGDEKHDVVANFMLDYVQDWIEKNNITSPWHATDINVVYDKSEKHAFSYVTYTFYFYIEDDSLKTNISEGHEYRVNFDVPYFILSDLDSGKIDKEQAYLDIKDSAKISFDDLSK